MKLLIFGASGSGTTTLGQAIASQTDFIHLDADDYYWKKTLPPYQEKVPLIERNRLLWKDFHAHPQVVISGSMVSWGKEWETAFDLVIFIRLDNDIRIERLRKRELLRYGDSLRTDETIRKTYEAFMEWANKYEDPDFEGRSYRIHHAWLEKVEAKTLKINGAPSLTQNVKRVLKAIQDFGESSMQPSS